MSFSLDKPGFLVSADVSQEACRDSPPPLPSTGSSLSALVPSLGILLLAATVRNAAGR